MQQQQITGLARLSATSNSWKGFVAAWTHEEAFRHELILVIIASPLALVLGNSWIERVLLLEVCFRSSLSSCSIPVSKQWLTG